MKVGFYWSAVIVCLAGTGCVVSRATYLADGHRGYSISCSGPLRSWSDCIRKAGTLCQSRGYVTYYSDDVDGRLFLRCRDQDR